MRWEGGAKKEVEVNGEVGEGEGGARGQGRANGQGGLLFDALEVLDCTIGEKAPYLSVFDLLPLTFMRVDIDFSLFCDKNLKIFLWGNKLGSSYNVFFVKFSAGTQ